MFTRTFIVVFLAALSVSAKAVVINRATGPGLPVGCAPLAQDFGRITLGLTAEDYWEGGGGHTVLDLLSPSNVPFKFNVNVPDKSLYPRFRGRSLPFAAVVCYPTSATNTRADLALPTGQSLPRMQASGEAPIFTDASTRYPVMTFAHGLGGSPLNRDYLDVIKGFASRGYIVVAPFFSDRFFTSVKVGDFANAVNLLFSYPQIAEFMALRALVMSAALDTLLTDRDFAPRIDTRYIGGFGASMGGQTLMLQQGAKLTTSLVSNAAEQVIVDSRVKAMVGYVPFSGHVGFSAFGDSNSGVRGIRTPYMALGGALDTVALMSRTEQVVGELSGSRYSITIADLEHTLRAEDAPEIFTWMDLFFKAHLFGDATARTTLSTATSVQGQTLDQMKISVTHPWWFQDEVKVVEYRHAGINHYFMSADPAEQTMLDNGTQPGWSRTGESWIAWRNGSPYGSPLCRLFAFQGAGKGTHFFSIEPTECAQTRTSPGWIDEGFGFHAKRVESGCVPPLIPLVRAYNNRFAQNDSNHRYWVKDSIRPTMQSAGWAVEGAAMCVTQ